MKPSRSIRIAGNWKMNQGVAQSIQFLKTLHERSRVLDEWNGLGGITLIFPQAPLLQRIHEEIQKFDLPIEIGPQNCFEKISGAFTGEISAELIREMECTQVLIGHSERRTLFGETNTSAVRRAITALNEGLTVVFCIGETEAQRKTGQTETVIFDQMTPLWENSEHKAVWMKALSENRFHIAYEPVWAIGTGVTPTAEDANQVHLWIRTLLTKNGSQTDGNRVSILYGGSVKPDHALGFLTQSEIDGLLAGGASLSAESFLSLIDAGIKATKQKSLS